MDLDQILRDVVAFADTVPPESLPAAKWGNHIVRWRRAGAGSAVARPVLPVPIQGSLRNILERCRASRPPIGARLQWAQEALRDMRAAGDIAFAEEQEFGSGCSADVALGTRAPPMQVVEVGGDGSTRVRTIAWDEAATLAAEGWM